MDDQVSNIVNSIGAIAEMTHLFCDNLEKAGFTHQDAMYLTKAFVTATFSAAVGNKGGKDE